MLALLGDVDPAVRANAAWSLGRSGSEAALEPLGRALGDSDVAVAGNAAVALARAALRGGRKETAAAGLCAGLADYRSYVRVGVLVGLRELGANCSDPAVLRHTLRRDRNWRVRAAAADLLRSRPLGAELDADARALVRCAAEDRDATVAAHCAGEVPAAGQTPLDRLVYVVPDGAVAPVPRAPFALVLPDGALRLGLADRRGAVFEVAAPGGPLRLAVPAALAD